VRHTWTWRWWLAVGLVILGGYFTLPSGSVAATLVYNAIGLCSGLAVLCAVRLHRPARPAMWYWFAAGQIVCVAGDLVYEFYDLVLHEQPYPSPADALYLATYPITVAGLLLLLRQRPGRGSHELIDAAIIATGLGMVFWVFVLHPIAAGSASSTFERWISTLYPAADALLLAMLARLFTDGGGRSPSTRLISLATLLVFGADVAFSLVSLYWDADQTWINAGFLLSYLCWGAAALHPSMAGGEARPAAPAGRFRLILFAGCSMLAPALLFVPRVIANAVDERAVAVGSIVLFLLGVTRLAGYMSQVQRQSAALERLALTDDLTGLANRRRLESAVREAIAAGGRPQILLLGLNGFKSVNEELGRPVGDRVLVALADRLRLAAFPAASLVARLGSDEFAVLLTDAGAAAVRELAERLVAAFRAPVVADGRELLVGVAVG
jgi:diguanylate cyclase (GGDEF)-like protein